MLEENNKCKNKHDEIYDNIAEGVKGALTGLR